MKQKLLAAHRAGITTVLIPSRNEPDLDDVPAEVRDALTVHPVSDVREVLELALEPAVGAVTPNRRPEKPTKPPSQVWPESGGGFAMRGCGRDRRLRQGTYLHDDCATCAASLLSKPGRPVRVPRRAGPLSRTGTNLLALGQTPDDRPRPGISGTSSARPFPLAVCPASKTRTTLRSRPSLGDRARESPAPDITRGLCRRACSHADRHASTRLPIDSAGVRTVVAAGRRSSCSTCWYHVPAPKPTGTRGHCRHPAGASGRGQRTGRPMTTVWQTPPGPDRGRRAGERSRLDRWTREPLDQGAGRTSWPGETARPASRARRCAARRTGRPRCRSARPGCRPRPPGRRRAPAPGRRSPPSTAGGR